MIEIFPRPLSSLLTLDFYHLHQIRQNTVVKKEVVTETTIGGFSGFDEKGVPEFYRPV